MIIAVTMCKLFAALALGYAATKTGMLDENTGKRLSALIVNAILPCLIISSVTGIKGDKSEVLAFFLTGVLFYCVFPLIGWVVAGLIRVPAELKGTYMCMVIFSNCSFMGFPVLSALFGNEAIFYSNIFHMSFNLMFFTLGIALLKRDANADGLRKNGAVLPGQRFRAIRRIINNGVIASVLALVIYFAQIPLPAVLTESLSFIGDTVMPLSMLVLGISIANVPMKEIFSSHKVYLISVVRLLVMPVLAYFAIRFFTDNSLLVKIVTITAGMPVATLVAMGSAPYPRQGREASMAVVFSTLCSLITIPVMCILLEYI